MANEITEKGKELAFLLRHDADGFAMGLIDKNGWRRVDELVKNHGFTRAMIYEIVETNNKKRFEYDQHKTRIRARQGHSIQVEVDLREVTDCKYLWHGTSDRFLDAIRKDGLKPQSRLYVHLSKDVETATSVGLRHEGKLRIIQIDAEQMLSDGEKIWVSNNDVYLAKSVDPKYFKNIIYR